MCEACTEKKHQYQLKNYRQGSQDPSEKYAYSITMPQDKALIPILDLFLR